MTCTIWHVSEHNKDILTYLDVLKSKCRRVDWNTVSSQGQGERRGLRVGLSTCARIETDIESMVVSASLDRVCMYEDNGDFDEEVRHTFSGLQADRLQRLTSNHPRH